MSDFGLSIAASGLIADSAELDTASNNLSNINTPGYAREVVNLSPEAAAGPLQAGRGVTVASVSSLTDAVYEAANVGAEGVQGAAGTTNQVMTSIESIFPEPSSDGLSAQLSTFWTDLSTLAANPNQAGAQQTVAADASGLAGALNTTSSQLSQLGASLQTEVAVGNKVSVTLPDGSVTPGVISSVSTATSSSSSSSSSSSANGSNSGNSGPSSGGSGSSAATITVVVSLTDPKAAGSLTQVPVQVTITTGSVGNVLIVPVDALLAQPGGGYAVEVTGPGGHHLVKVTPGLFDDAAGTVQVTGNLAPGQRVVVPGI